MKITDQEKFAHLEFVADVAMNELETLESASMNHSGNLDLVFKDYVGDCEICKEDFEKFFEMFPYLVLEHAYNGLSGGSFEVTFR